MRGEEGRGQGGLEDGMPTERPPACGAMRRRFFRFSQQSHPHTASLSPNAEGKMRAIIPTLIGLVALAATSVQAAPVPTNPHHHSKWRETPTQNVRKSNHYDHLVSTNSSFRAFRMRKECGPISDAELRADCLGSFSTYEPR